MIGISDHGGWVASHAEISASPLRDSASWAMVELLQQEKKLSRLDAYSLASMVMDCRLAAPNAAEKVVHCLVPKSTWVASR